MSYEWLEMQREAERHAAIEQYLRNRLMGVQCDPAYGTATTTMPVQSHCYDPSYAVSASHFQDIAPALGLTQSDKIRATFTDLDYNKNGYIDVGELKRGLQDCKLNFTDPTAEDLFTKAKAGRSGDITEAEWGAFICKYPMMLDALYFRFRAINSASQDAEAARANQERLAERARALQDEADAAAKDALDSDSKLQNEAQKLGEAERKKKDAENAHQSAVREVGEAFRRRQEKEQQVAAEWEATRAHRIAAAEAARDADVAQRRLAAAEDREKWARQALEEALREKEAAASDLGNAKARLAEAESKGGCDPEKVLQEADKEVAEAQRREYELGAAAAEAAVEADRLRWAKDEQDRLKAAADARRERAQAALEEARKAVEENNRRLAEAEDVKAAGPKVDEKENTLVEQEVRLREQRECLEEKEQALKKECTEYTNRVSPVRERPSPNSSLGHNSPYATPAKTWGTPQRQLYY